MNTKDIVHRDIKPDNILISEGICKIADFGLSKHSAKTNLTTSGIGTKYFMAPEMIDSDLGGKNSKVDIWALGCTAYYMFFFDMPFKGEPQCINLAKEILTQELVYPLDNGRQISVCLK